MARRVDYVELTRLRNLGMPYAEIATLLQCCVSSVERATARLDLERRQRGPRRDIDVPVLHSLWSSELELPEIAVRLGCSVSTLPGVSAGCNSPASVDEVCKHTSAQ